MTSRSREDMDFIEESRRRAKLASGEVTSEDEVLYSTAEEYNRIPWWKRYITWSAFFFICALLSSGATLALFMALEKVYSVDTIKYILESGGLVYAKETKDYFLLSIYDYKWAIILGLFALFLMLSILMLLLELRRIKKIDEKNMLLQESDSVEDSKSDSLSDEEEQYMDSFNTVDEVENEFPAEDTDIEKFLNDQKNRNGQ